MGGRGGSGGEVGVLGRVVDVRWRLQGVYRVVCKRCMGVCECATGLIHFFLSYSSETSFSFRADDWLRFSFSGLVIIALFLSDDQTNLIGCSLITVFVFMKRYNFHICIICDFPH